jgi:hypothetical protein
MDIMRTPLLAGLAVLAISAAAHADALRRTVSPMTRADGEVCDLLRAEAGDTCKRIAQEGSAAVYQSRGRITAQAAAIRRLVLAIDTGNGVLVGPAVDVLDDQLASTHPTLRPVTIDGHRGVALDLVSTWKRGGAAERSEALVGCVPSDAIWKCSLVDVGACRAELGDDARVTTSCGTSSTLSIAGSQR